MVDHVSRGLNCLPFVKSKGIRGKQYVVQLDSGISIISQNGPFVSNLINSINWSTGGSSCPVKRGCVVTGVAAAWPSSCFHVLNSLQRGLVSNIFRRISALYSARTFPPINIKSRVFKVSHGPATPFRRPPLEYEDSRIKWRDYRAFAPSAPCGLRFLVSVPTIDPCNSGHYSLNHAIRRHKKLQGLNRCYKRNDSAETSNRQWLLPLFHKR